MCVRPLLCVVASANYSGLQLRQLLSDWRSYFFKVAARLITPFFLAEGAVEIDKGEVKAVGVAEVAALAEKTITNGAAFYRQSHENEKVGHCVLSACGH